MGRNFLTARKFHNRALAGPALRGEDIGFSRGTADWGPPRTEDAVRAAESEGGRPSNGRIRDAVPAAVPGRGDRRITKLG